MKKLVIHTSLLKNFDMNSSENTSAKFICEICENGYSTNTYKEQYLLLVHGEQKNIHAMFATRYLDIHII